MCGIVGFATSYKNGFVSSEMDAFYNMLYFDALRGFDSTGVFGVDNVGNVQVHKEATHALDFMRNKELHEFKREAISAGKIVVGHNRAATRGEIKDENAHPFVIEDRIVLVQNGTWSGSHKHIKDTEVDTEALAHLIYENVDDIPKAFEKINAAYALCWYDVTKKTIYLARNKERPLFLARTKGGAYSWCSEPGFLRVALARNSIEVDTVELIPEKKLVSFTIQDQELVRQADVDLPSFRFTHQPTNKNWPYTGDDPDEQIHQVTPRYPRQLTHVRTTTSGGTTTSLGDDSVEFDFGTIAFNNLADCAISPQEAQTIFPMMETLTKSKQPIELIDYKPANTSRTCKTWHVYGHLVIPDENHILNNVIVHWYLHGKTETEVMDYVAHAFYSVTMNSLRKHEFHTLRNKCFMTSLVTSPIPVPTVNVNALQ